MFIEIDNFLDKKSCEEIIRRCSAHIDKNKLDIEYNRQGNSVDTNQHEELKDLDQKIFKRLNLFITKRLSYSFSLNNVDLQDTGYTFHRYEKGDKLYCHADGLFSFESGLYHYVPPLLPSHDLVVTKFTVSPLFFLSLIKWHSYKSVAIANFAYFFYHLPNL